MTFEELENQIINLGNLPNIEGVAVGFSTLGQTIYGYHIGNYEGKQILKMCIRDRY